MKDTAEIGKDLIVSRTSAYKSRESKEKGEVESAYVELWMCGNGINISATLTPEGAEKLADELRGQALIVRDLLTNSVSRKKSEVPQ